MASFQRNSEHFGKAPLCFVPFFTGATLLFCFNAAVQNASPGLREQDTHADRQQPSEQQYPRNAKSPYERWVNEEVAIIMTSEERDMFAKLKTDKDREQFIKDFWERRNPNPGSVENKFKEQYYRRVAYARQHFHYLTPGPSDDRGRIYILFGPPDTVESLAPNSQESATDKSAAVPVKERWTYNKIEGIGEHVSVEFIDPSRSGAYRVVTDPETLRRPSG